MRWPRWTPSSRLGPSLPTSLTPGAGPARRPSPPGFRSCFRPARPGHPYQYFRGHPALRHRGARHRERGPQTGHRRAAGGAARRDQRGGRAAHPPGKRPPVPHRFLHVRGGPPDRRARGGIPSGGRCMSILIDDGSRVLVQGITGREGQFHTERMIRYGTRVVGGVTPGRGGQPTLGVPVFDSVRQAVRETGADVSVAFVPAALAADAACEASEAGIRLVVVIAEHVPVLDMVRVKAFFRERGTLLVGPNCPGIISPGKCKVGIMPGYIHRPGGVGLVSRSGTADL